MKELVTQLCLIVCDPMDCSLPSSSVYEILQTRTLKWEAISFSRGSSWVKPGSPALQKILYRLSHQGSPPLSVLLLLLLSHFSCVWLCVTPWTVACQARLSMGFSRQQYWSDLPCPPPQDLPHPGTEPGSPALQADSLPLSHQGSPSLYIWLAKKFVWFLSKNKRHIFHFYQPLYWTTYSPKWWWNHFFPLSSAIFQATSLFHLPKTFHLFEQRTAPGDFLQSFRELKFFPLTEFCKDWNKWKSESEMSGEYGGWIRTSQPNCNSVCLVIKETRSLEFPWWKSAFCADLFQTLFFQLV